MRDADLIAYGRAAAFLAGRSDRETWRVQLEEARAEWRRRHKVGLATVVDTAAETG